MRGFLIRAKRPLLFSYFRPTCDFVSVICMKYNCSSNTDGAWLNLFFSFNPKEDNCSIFLRSNVAVPLAQNEMIVIVPKNFSVISFILQLIHKSNIYHFISVSRYFPLMGLLCNWDCSRRPQPSDPVTFISCFCLTREFQLHLPSIW